MGGSRPLPREQREAKEILPQRACGAGCHILVEKESTEFLPRAKDLPTTRPAPAGVARRQVEQLEGARQGSIEPVGPLRLPRGDGTVNLGAHIAELLGERKRCPAARRKSDVDRHSGPSALHQRTDNLANAILESAILDIS